MSELYDLPEQAREAWQTWVKDRLRVADSDQRNIAFAVFGAKESDPDSPSNTTEVNRFVRGAPQVLRRWFEVQPERAAAAAEEMDLPVQALRDKLAALAAGEVGRAEPWHPAFPGVPEREALIPTPLSGARAGEPEGIARELVRTMPAPESWTKRTLLPVFMLRGPPGRAWDIAARQLAEALEGALQERVAQLVAEREAAREARPDLAPLQIPDFDVVIQPEDGPRRPLRISVQREAEPPRIELRLSAWGPEQALDLATRLGQAPSVSPKGRAALKRFAERLTEHPGWIGPEMDRDLIIRWLAQVAQDGAPSSAKQARGLLTRGAWTRLLELHPRLEPFGEALLDRFFAGMADLARAPSALGPWTRVSRAQALALAEAALTALPQERAALIELVEALSKPGRGRAERYQALREALATPSPEGLLGALEDGSLLRRAPWDSLQATSPELAAIHAARGLEDLSLLRRHPERLVDPLGATLVEALAHQGAGWADLVDTTEGLSPALAVDICLARLRFA
ncbi:MAG: hypothetical protein H6741_21000 [Alphaproteobacteria bacterium]|nr:hypothetical protein [Alphaproteobacteria bacterium]